MTMNPDSGHVPGLPSVNLSAVMAGLLMPLAGAELEDRELVRLEKRAKREAKERAENAWHVAYLRVESAWHTYLAASCLASVAVFHSSDSAENAAARAAEDEAFRLYGRAVDALMRVPAATKENLRWKREHAHLRADWRKHLHSKKEANPEWAKLIAADEKRLAVSR
jgi:hypothetical protein